MTWLAAFALVAALGLAACGGSGGATTTPTTTKLNAPPAKGSLRKASLISAYCLYRSDTKAQALACEKQTNVAKVAAGDDDAERWARGELRRCGEGAGRLCHQLYRAVLEGALEGEGH